MPKTKEMSSLDLVACFLAMASAPPPEASQLLARHLQCKQSMQLAEAIRQAMERFPGSDPLILPASHAGCDYACYAVPHRTGGGSFRRVPQRDEFGRHDGGFHRPNALNK